MDYYLVAATAIPALWVAAGLLREPETDSVWLGRPRSLLRLLLACGEVASMAILAAGRDGYVGAAATTAALAVGAGVVVGRSTAKDFKRHRTPIEVGVPVLFAVIVVVFAYDSKR